MAEPQPDVIWRPAWAVADYLRIHRKTLMNWVNRGKLPHYREGRALYVDYDTALALREAMPD